MSALLLAIVQDAPSALAPAGPAASRIALLAWYLIALTVAIALVVFALLAVGLRRRGRGHIEDPPEIDLPDGAVRRWVIYGGAVIPAAVLAVTLVIVLVTLMAAGTEADDANADIVVIGHQWWWEIRYPQLGIVDANEVHIPVGRRVRVEVRTADVIHSFWVPQLHGKLDLVPGKRNELQIEAARPGIFQGACAEYCGAQHAHMGISVIAHPQTDYDAWLASARMPARAPPDSVAAYGARLFMENGCAFCHTIRGTPARGTIGPDLTHVGARRTIAAGMLPATRASFGGWIANPHILKPGTLMPAFVLPGEQLRALAVYLEALK